MKKKKETTNLGELNKALELLEKEKGIKRDFIFEALETALLHAYRKNYREDHENTVVKVDRENGDIRVIATRIAVENIGDIAECNEMTLEDARKINPDIKVGETIDVDILPRDFGRIAAQTAKNIILQKIREAERENILREFDMKVGDILSGYVKRIERIPARLKSGEPDVNATPKYNIFFDIGKTEVVLSTKGQIPGEEYRIGQKLLLCVSEISSTAKGPFVQVSRANAEFVAKLFEREVPEIKDGVVEIKGVAREAGQHTKLAVHSNDENVEAVGSCVGNKGSRVNAIVEALGGEKIEIIKYSENPDEFISAAIAPAKAKCVMINYEALESGRKEATVVVEESQLSLAIGKVGLNAKLAARLTGWKIDIKSDTQYDAELAKSGSAMMEAMSAFENIMAESSDEESEDEAE